MSLIFPLFFTVAVASEFVKCHGQNDDIVEKGTLPKSADSQEGKRIRFISDVFGPDPSSTTNKIIRQFASH